MKILKLFFVSVLIIAAFLLYGAGGLGAVIHFTALSAGNFGFIGFLLGLVLSLAVWITGGMFIAAIIKALNTDKK
jgi:hypothetical protein